MLVFIIIWIWLVYSVIINFQLVCLEYVIISCDDIALTCRVMNVCNV